MAAADTAGPRLPSAGVCCGERSAGVASPLLGKEQLLRLRLREKGLRAERLQVCEGVERDEWVKEAEY
jgi:hypothetical protein